MSDVAYIGDLFGTVVEPRVLEQYRESERWQACLKAVISKKQIVEDAAYELAHVLDFKTERPTGKRLDWIAGLINVRRFNGETDEDFYSRFISRLGVNTAGTPDNIIYNSAILAGDPAPQYIDESTATFVVYTGPRNENAVTDGESFDYENNGEDALTGGANQLLRRQVQQLAPAGVLGLVGAAIELADGSLLGDAQGRLLMAVADDSTAVRELVLVDNNLSPILDPQNTPIRAVIKGATVPKVKVDIDGQYYDGVRIKDLPDAGLDNAYMVRDSDSGGTVRTEAMTENGLDDLWDATEPEE